MVRPEAVDRRVWRSVAACVALVLVVDGGSKFLATRFFEEGALYVVVPRSNHGLALGVISATTSLPVLLAFFVLASAVLGHVVYLTMTLRLAPIGSGLLFGGALANAVDRAATGVVHDWLRVGVVILNVADLAILVGLLLYFRSSWELAEQSPSRVSP